MHVCPHTHTDTHTQTHTSAHVQYNNCLNIITASSYTLGTSGLFQLIKHKEAVLANSHAKFFTNFMGTP